MSRRSSTVERRIRNARVGGSTPLAGSSFFQRVSSDPNEAQYLVSGHNRVLPEQAESPGG